MDTRIEQTIEAMLQSSGLQGTARDDLRRELTSHYAEAMRDLELAGESAEKTAAVATERFGDGQHLGGQLRTAYRRAALLRLAPWIIAGGIIVLPVIIYPLAILLLATLLSPFFLAYWGLTLLALAVVLIICSRLAKRGRLRSEPFLAALTIVSLGANLLWLTLFLFERRMTSPFYGGIMDPVATGGFPFQALAYPMPPMGSDEVPLEAWPGFFANYLFWLLMAAIFYPLLPKSWTDRTGTRILATIAAILSLISSLILLLRFD